MKVGDSFISEGKSYEVLDQEEANVRFIQDPDILEKYIHIVAMDCDGVIHLFIVDTIRCSEGIIHHSLYCDDAL